MAQQRCVTEYYITPSLHTQGAGTLTHTHTCEDSQHTLSHAHPARWPRGGAGMREVGPQTEEQREHRTGRAWGPPPRLRAPAWEAARWSLRDVCTTLGACGGHANPEAQGLSTCTRLRHRHSHTALRRHRRPPSPGPLSPGGSQRWRGGPWVQGPVVLPSALLGLAHCLPGAGGAHWMCAQGMTFQLWGCWLPFSPGKPPSRKSQGSGGSHDKEQRSSQLRPRPLSATVSAGSG